jgi:hypothetical protein
MLAESGHHGAGVSDAGEFVKTTPGFDLMIKK